MNLTRVSKRYYDNLQYVETKTCYECEQTKPVNEFLKGRSLCKVCQKQRNAEEYASGANPRRSYDGVFATSIMRYYGLTMDDYELMLKRQAYRCAVCRRPETKLRKNGEPYRLAVDHDHVTKKARGLVCHKCNMIVWALEENHTLIPAIFAYVEKFRDSLVDDVAA